MQYRLRVYGRIYRKVAFLDTQSSKETSLDQLVKKKKRDIQVCSELLQLQMADTRAGSNPVFLLPWQGA